MAHVHIAVGVAYITMYVNLKPPDSPLSVVYQLGDVGSPYSLYDNDYMKPNWPSCSPVDKLKRIAVKNTTVSLLVSHQCQFHSDRYSV